jgi:hypothetical protein
VLNKVSSSSNAIANLKLFYLKTYLDITSYLHVMASEDLATLLLLFFYYYSTANGFSPGGIGTTIRQQTNNTQDNRQ